jgi:hypothetical protein
MEAFASVTIIPEKPLAPSKYLKRKLEESKFLFFHPLIDYSLEAQKMKVAEEVESHQKRQNLSKNPGQGSLLESIGRGSSNKPSSSEMGEREDGTPSTGFAQHYPLERAPISQTPHQQYLARFSPRPFQNSDNQPPIQPSQQYSHAQAQSQAHAQPQAQPYQQYSKQSSPSQNSLHSNRSSNHPDSPNNQRIPKTENSGFIFYSFFFGFF